MTSSPPPADAWKDQVAQRFGAASVGYDAAAGSQQAIAATLAGHCLPRLQEKAPRRVLEIGCGTGFLTAALLPALPSVTDWHATDLAAPMLVATRQRIEALGIAPARVHTAVMDGEAPTLSGRWDLVCSSLAVQWFRDLRAGLQRLIDNLAPGGLLAVTTLGCDSFALWQQVCAEDGLSTFASRYPDADLLRQWFPSASIHEHHQPLDSQATGIAFLRALRAIGADSPPPDHQPAPPAALRRAIRRLGARSGGTYHVLTVLAERPCDAR